MRELGVQDELYVAARKALLDALEALGEHRAALVLVGAQAIYQRVGEADIAVAAYTTDGDLAIDPKLLAEIPPLERELQRLKFNPTNVGTWSRNVTLPGGKEVPVAIDLLVPRAVQPQAGTRAANLQGHEPKAARVVVGLEGVLVDNDNLRVAALAPSDSRAFEIAVAGGAALLVAKVHKIAEREGTPRSKDKDALDVYRLLKGSEEGELAARYKRLLSDDRSRDVALKALSLFSERFVKRDATGVEMLLRSVELVEDPEQVATSCNVLAKELLDALAGD